MSECHSPYVVGNLAFNTPCPCSCHWGGECSCNCNHSYYGRIDNVKPIRNLTEDFVKEREQTIMHEMKEMEDRIKRHVTECKRQVIKEIQTIFKKENLIINPTKEVKNDKRNTKNIIK